jgi:hypothetical protein
MRLSKKSVALLVSRKISQEKVNHAGH